MDRTVFIHLSFDRWEVLLFGCCELFLLQALEGNVNIRGNKAYKAL